MKVVLNYLSTWVTSINNAIDDKGHSKYTWYNGRNCNRSNRILTLSTKQVITQKKAYNIQNTAKVWNQGKTDFVIDDIDDDDDSVSIPLCVS